MLKPKCPFQDKDGKIVFSYRAIHDKVFIWPFPNPEKYIEDGVVEIPIAYRESHRCGIGILLSVGKGYWGKDNQFYPAPPELQPGVEVYYYKGAPWREKAMGLDRQEHVVVLCGTADIHGLCEDE